MRVLHGLSFIDDPTRILRAVRFEERYGFAMDPGTADAARRAVELDMLSEVSGARIREELLGILAEKSPGMAFARLEALGALARVAAGGVRAGGGARQAIAAVEEALARLGDRFQRPPKRVVALVACVGLGGRPGRRPSAGCATTGLARSTRRPALELAERGPKTLSALQDRRGMRDSRLYHLLSPLPCRGDREPVGAW